jgi:hypothetical protein
MARIKRTERYQRGVFGWFFRILFLAFNLVMVTSLGFLILLLPAVVTPLKVIIFFAWLLGALILGVLSYVTRGNKVIIEEDY